MTLNEDLLYTLLNLGLLHANANGAPLFHDPLGKGVTPCLAEQGHFPTQCWLLCSPNGQLTQEIRSSLMELSHAEPGAAGMERQTASDESLGVPACRPLVLPHLGSRAREHFLLEIQCHSLWFNVHSIFWKGGPMHSQNCLHTGASPVPSEGYPVVLWG